MTCPVCHYISDQSMDCQLCGKPAWGRCKVSGVQIVTDIDFLLLVGLLFCPPLIFGK